MNTVPLATFNELGPALKLKERLLQADIFASINDESKRERFSFLSQPFAAIHVEVEQTGYLRTRKIVEDWDRADGVLKDAMRCPDCNSSRIEYPQLTRKFVMPAVASLLFLFRLLPREFYCLDCHYTWPLKEPVEPERDVLGFPYESKVFHPERAKPAKPH